jgi:hypothetical protein
VTFQVPRDGARELERERDDGLVRQAEVRLIAQPPGNEQGGRAAPSRARPLSCEQTSQTPGGDLLDASLRTDRGSYRARACDP